MTAHTGSCLDEKPPPVLRILIVVIVGMVLGAILLTPHAFERHGRAAFEAVECYNNDGPVMSLLNPKSQRVASICQSKFDNAWYVVIVCVLSGCLITAFKRDRARCKRDVESYLRESGFNKVL